MDDSNRGFYKHVRFYSEGDVFSFCRVLKWKLMKLYLYSTMTKLTKLYKNSAVKNPSQLCLGKSKKKDQKNIYAHILIVGRTLSIFPAIWGSVISGAHERHVLCWTRLAWGERKRHPSEKRNDHTGEWFVPSTTAIRLSNEFITI